MKKQKLRNYVVTEFVEYIVLATSEENACREVENDKYRDRYCGEVTDRSATLYKPVKREPEEKKARIRL